MEAEELRRARNDAELKQQILDQDLHLLDETAKKVIRNFLDDYKKIDNVNKDELERIIKNLIISNKTNFKGVGQPLRIVLTGSKFGPGVYEIILSLDKEEVVKRLKMIN